MCPSTEPRCDRTLVTSARRQAPAPSGARSTRNLIVFVSFSDCRDSGPDVRCAAQSDRHAVSPMEITMKPVRIIFTLGALVLSVAVAYAQGGQDFSKVEI